MEETKKEPNPFDIMMNEISKLVEAKTKPLVDKISEMQRELNILKQPVVMPDAKKFLNSKEVCEWLGIHENTLSRKRESGEIECHRIGQFYRYTKEAIQKYEDSIKFKKPEIALSLKKGHKTSHGGEAQCAPPRTSLNTSKAKKISA